MSDDNVRLLPAPLPPFLNDGMVGVWEMPRSAGGQV